MVDASDGGGGGGGSVSGFFYVRRPFEHHRVVHICLYPAHVAHSRLLTAPAVASGGAVSKKAHKTHKRQHYVMDLVGCCVGDLAPSCTGPRELQG